MWSRYGRRRTAIDRTAVIAALLVGALLCAAHPADAQSEAPFVRNELLVRLRDGATGADLANLFARLGIIGITVFDSVEGLYRLRLPAGLDVARAKAIAAELDGVAYAEPNFLVSIGATLPNDPSFATLWALNNTGQSGGTTDADIDAPEAWAMTTGSADVVVAILDTGLDYTHPDLAANLFMNIADCNANGIDDDGNGYADDCYGIDTFNRDSNPMDDHRHGTHTAGTIGASGDNGVGVTGVSWHVKLMPCKFLGAGGSGSTADAITCLEYIANMKHRGVNIVATNNSWGGGGYSQALYDAIEQQRQLGILFIAAAGNATSDNDATPHYPSSYDLPNLIAVASTTRNDGQSSFSNYGRRTVHLGAPGSEILSTSPGNDYVMLSGTSMATPHVTGVAALLKAQQGARDWRAIKNLILAGADPVPALGASTVTGRRLNAHGSLACSGATLFARVKPVAETLTGSVGAGITLSALHVNCAAGAGTVHVAVSGGGNPVTLVDNGIAPDQAAEDGIYTGTFTPATTGTRTLTFPDNSTLTVHVLTGIGYTAQTTAYNYRQITGTNLGLGDDTSAAISTPFPIWFGGTTFDSLYVSSNGTINVSSVNNTYANTSLPTTAATSLIAPFWDDLYAGAASDSNVFWAAGGAAPHRELVIEWRNITGYGLLSGASCPSTEAVRFQVVFFESNSDVLFNYADTTFGPNCAFRNGGASATIGIQSSPEVARQHSHNVATLADGTALLWTLRGSPGSPFTDDPLTGGVTIKVAHFLELRARIDSQRLRYGLMGAAWTDAPLMPGVTVKAQHVMEMRTALAEAYVAARLSPPLYTQPQPQAGITVITAMQIAELRAATVALESQ